MRFMVRRGWDDSKPCDDAVEDVYLCPDVRTVHCPTLIPFYEGKPEAAKEMWYGDGLNHRVEGGRIVRDRQERAWFIELDVEGLVALCLKYSDAAISKSDSKGGEPLLRLGVEVS